MELLACDSIAVPDWTRMFQRASWVDSSATSTSMMRLLAASRLALLTVSTSATKPRRLCSAPFVARMVESSLEEIDTGVIEAARCMGATSWQIVWKVLLVESVPSIVRGISITTITLIGYGAMAGAVGAGGLGKIGYSYGFQRFNAPVMYVTVVLLIIIVCIIQGLFNRLAKAVDKRDARSLRHRRGAGTASAATSLLSASSTAMQGAAGHLNVLP